MNGNDCAVREALTQVQWGNVEFDPMSGESGSFYNHCPLCDQSAARGHAPDCLVGMALAAPCVPAEDPEDLPLTTYFQNRLLGVEAANKCLTSALAAVKAEADRLTRHVVDLQEANGQLRTEMQAERAEKERYADRVGQIEDIVMSAREVLSLEGYPEVRG